MPGFMQRPLKAIFLVVLTAALESACHKKQASIPVPPAPAPAATTPESTTPTTETPPNPTLPTPPTTQPSVTPPAATQPTPPNPTPPATPEDQPKPPARRPARVPPNPAAPGPNQPPRLGTLLTPEQQRQYNYEIDRSLGRAQASLRAIGNRQLTVEQHDRVTQVENFIQQAQALRKSNLAGAKSLAERADVLARDLVASIH